MSRVFWLAATACALLTAASPYTVQLRPEACAAARAETLASLGPAWQAVGRFVQTCPVRAPDGSVALTVEIVRLDRAAAEHAVPPSPPTPLIRDLAGRVLGDLQEGFPVDPPGRLRVTFADWTTGLPHRIDLFEAGVSAVPPHKLAPMLWDEASHGFLTETQPSERLR